MPDLPEAERDDLTPISKEIYWSLEDTLVWVATRNLGAIARVRKSENSPAAALSVWRSISGNNVTSLELEDAWESLSQAMTDGLTAFATRRQRQASGGIEQSELGILFPPKHAPGSPINCRVAIHDRKAVLVPAKFADAHSWVEWTDFRFKREKVLEIFGPLEASDTADIAKEPVEPISASPGPKKSRPALTPGEIRIQRAIDEIWIDGKLPGKAADRDKLIRKHHEVSGETAPSSRAIQRYLKKVQN